MERQLDDVAGSCCSQSLEARGLKFLMGAQTEACWAGEDGRVMRVRLQGRQRDPGRPGGDGRRHPPQHRTGRERRPALQPRHRRQRHAADGDRPAHLRGGRMRGAPRHRLRPGGAAVRAGKVCATHLAQFGIGRYTGSQTSTKLKVTGIDLFSAGNFRAAQGTEEIVLSDPLGGVYKKLVIQDDKLVGACLYGDTVDGSWYFKLLREGRKIADIRDKLMFGESNIGDVGHQGHNKAAAMADSDEVCGCNGVTKGTICKAIKDKGLFTLDEVRKHTKASASCGSAPGWSSSC
jgi:nitrite reductase (NADH) large subunit